MRHPASRSTPFLSSLSLRVSNGDISVEFSCNNQSIEISLHANVTRPHREYYSFIIPTARYVRRAIPLAKFAGSELTCRHPILQDPRGGSSEIRYRVKKYTAAVRSWTRAVKFEVKRCPWGWEFYDEYKKIWTQPDEFEDITRNSCIEEADRLDISIVGIAR